MISTSKSPVQKSIILIVLSLFQISGWTGEQIPAPKPVPRMQVLPLPLNQASFQYDGMELTRYYFDASLYRPFLYPMIGPSGRSLTRIGHPRDPETHSHHNSVWIAHNHVDGVDFWSDRGDGKIVHKRIVQYEDGNEEAYLIADNDWVTRERKVLMKETRRVTVHPLADKEWLLLVDLELKADKTEVTLGQTPFGVMSVRMAKTIGVNDGGGTIRNSEGGVNEKEVFWKQARWVDYSGPITNEKSEGITLFDHPDNPNFPSSFHVRNDGWMGASLTKEATRTIPIDRPLELRYGLFIHNDVKSMNLIETQWGKFSKTHAK